MVLQKSLLHSPRSQVMGQSADDGLVLNALRASRMGGRLAKFHIREVRSPDLNEGYRPLEILTAEEPSYTPESDEGRYRHSIRELRLVLNPIVFHGPWREPAHLAALSCS